MDKGFELSSLSSRPKSGVEATAHRQVECVVTVGLRRGRVELESSLEVSVGRLEVALERALDVSQRGVSGRQERVQRQCLLGFRLHALERAEGLLVPLKGHGPVGVGEPHVRSSVARVVRARLLEAGDGVLDPPGLATEPEVTSLEIRLVRLQVRRAPDANQRLVRTHELDLERPHDL